MCATAAAAMVSAGNVAIAQDGWYGRADLGYSFDGTLDHDPEPDSLYSLGGDSSLDGGLAGAQLGLGYGFDNGFRLESTIGYRGGSLDPDGVINGGPPVDSAIYRYDAGSDGKIGIWDLMFNGLYDFNPEGQVQPYLGAGIGLAQVDAKAFSLSALLPDDTPVTVNGFSDSDTSIAYQLLAGVGYDVTDQITLDLGYKYFVAEDLDFAGRGPGTAGNPRIPVA
ncbi:porin family protein, partial [Henriciella mobilis]